MSGRPAPCTLGPALKAYGLLWKAARPYLARHQRLRSGFAQRLAPEDWARPADLWIQAASGGEAYLTWALLRGAAKDLNAGLPAPSLLLTTCTEQGRQVLQRAADWFAGATGLPAPQVCFFPLDEPALMRRALALAAPRAVLLLETELWPGLLTACRQAGVPVLLGNGRLTAKSLRHYKLLPLSWWEYLAPQAILAISQTDAARFAALFGPARVKLMPNLKFENLLEEAAPPVGLTRFFPPRPPRPDEESNGKNNPGPGGGPSVENEPESCRVPRRSLGRESNEENNSAPAAPVILFASVRKAELRPALDALARVRKALPHAVVVLAPRHLHHVPLWQKALAELAGQASGGAVQLRSQAEGSGRAFTPGAVVIWDAFGELNGLYARADAVFVGGSLAPLGGQNFLEPLAQGVVPVIGPAWDNFAWAADLVAPDGPVQVAENPAEVAQYLTRQAVAPQDRAAVRQTFREAVLRHQGGASLLWAAVREVIF